MDERQQFLAAAQELARAQNRTTLTKDAFASGTGLSAERARRLFGGWSAFIRAAGLVPGKPGQPKIGEAEIFAAMAEAFRAQGGVGAQREFQRHFRLGRNILWRQGWTWTEALARFRAWAQSHGPAFPYLDQLPARVPPEARRARKGSRGPRMAGAPSAGDLLGFRCFARAPTTELAVAMLFALVAAELGFEIEAAGPAFPDCRAHRRVGRGRWQQMRIEFELASRSFAAHHHDPAACDLLVCWEHNWPAAPLPVLELKKAIRRLPGWADSKMSPISDIATCTRSTT